MGIKLKDLLVAQGKLENNDETSYLKKIEKQAKEVVFVWDNYRLDEKRLNKELKKLYEIIKRKEDE